MFKRNYDFMSHRFWDINTCLLKKLRDLVWTFVFNVTKHYRNMKDIIPDCYRMVKSAANAVYL